MDEERIVPLVPELSSCNHLSVHGHHVYKEFWVSVVGEEELQVLWEEKMNTIEQLFQYRSLV